MRRLHPRCPLRWAIGRRIMITDIETFLVGTTRDPGPDTDIRGRNWIYVKIHTDHGIHGIGEAYSGGPDETTVKVIEDYKRWLVGQDPRNIQYLWGLMYNTTRFPGGSVVLAAMSGVEHALWDIAGKAAGLPVWALLGGRVHRFWSNRGLEPFYPRCRSFDSCPRERDMSRPYRL